MYNVNYIWTVFKEEFPELVDDVVKITKQKDDSIALYRDHKRPLVFTVLPKGMYILKSL